MFSLLPSRVHTRPSVSNTNHWTQELQRGGVLKGNGYPVSSVLLGFVQGMIGFGIYYDLGRLRLGADLTAVFNKDIQTVVIAPRLDAVVAKWLTLSAFYFYKGNYPFALYDASQLYNSFDEIKYKASFTGNFTLTKKLNTYLTYQFEGIRDNFSQFDYHLHTLLIGLNLRL